jgi:3-ketosteroid 9alpha-monooxygenase subunit A
MRDWPSIDHTTGWYQVDWTEALRPGDVKPLSIFDTEVVVYRTDDGRACVADAFCPHMGAHLGHGGCVRGSQIVCPWHGWEFDTDGTNTAIPFIERTTARVGLRQWPTREVGGIVITWFDSLGREPFWEWPGVPEFDDPEHFWHPVPHAFHAFGKRAVLPQSPLENAADSQHLPFVHGAGGPATHVAWEEQDHYIRTVFSITFGIGRDSTWLTPNGPAESYIESEFFGLGLGVARFIIDGMVVPQLVAVTPVDKDHSLLFSSVAGTRLAEHGDSGPSGRVLRMMTEQHAQIGNDFRIWENQRYVSRPAYSGIEERWFPPIRRWAEQFYPSGPQRPTGRDGDDSAPVLNPTFRPRSSDDRLPASAS